MAIGRAVVVSHPITHTAAPCAQAQERPRCRSARREVVRGPDTVPDPDTRWLEPGRAGERPAGAGAAGERRAGAAGDTGRLRQLRALAADRKSVV